MVGTIIGRNIEVVANITMVQYLSVHILLSHQGQPTLGKHTPCLYHLCIEK